MQEDNFRNMQRYLDREYATDFIYSLSVNMEEYLFDPEKIQELLSLSSPLKKV